MKTCIGCKRVMALLNPRDIDQFTKFVLFVEQSQYFVVKTLIKLENESSNST